jgi:methionyl-tRNA formyltransferase
VSELRAVVLCCEGPFQRHLVRRVAEEFDLEGVVWVRPPQPKGSLRDRLARYCSLPALRRYVEARALLPRYERRGEALRRELMGSDHAPLPDVPRFVTDQINSAEVAAFVSAQAPDIVLVNGTPLLRSPLLELLPRIPLGIINLHTGLSPYSRGGNCNLFMLLEGRPELVGNTVHHIDAGIDSGDIILSEQVPMQADDCWEMIDVRTFQSGIELLLQGAALLHDGDAPRVAQWEAGKLFLKRTGYTYEPWHRLAANRVLARGLVCDYLADKARRDATVRLVGAAR